MHGAFWWLGLTALAVWSTIFLIYFRREIRRWIRRWPERRTRKLEAKRKAAAAQARAADELAAKYPLPNSLVK